MILIRYILKRFFIQVFFINISLTLLFNLIEFFEKIVRVKDAKIETILYFIALQIIPSFFENLPIASWLASCITLKEMHQQNEWETLKLLNIKIKTIISLIFIAGIILATVSFFGKEFGIDQIAQKAETFKQKQFKQNSNKIFFNQWFALNDKTFSHFHYLNLTTKKGSNFSLFKLSPKFKIEKITSSKTFSIEAKAKEIIIQNGIDLLTKTKEQHLIKNKKLFLPSFFTQLQIKKKSPSLKQIFQLVTFDRKTIPKHVFHQLLYIFLNRILFHLLLILYPLLTFVLFFLFPYYRFYRWILIFTPYPLITILFTINDSLMQSFQNGFIAIIPYAIISSLITILYNTIRKQS